jgi:hypothetical protein
MLPMHNSLWNFLTIAAVTLVALLAVAGLLHLIPRLGPLGRRIAQSLTRAPALDWLVIYFSVIPLIVGPIVGGWAGLLAGVVGQVMAVLVWVRLHELSNRQQLRGPRIVKSLNRIVGRWPNHAALWLTAIVGPGFSLIRLAEILCYPLLIQLVGLPKYNHSEWVNVSRQRFQGLIGHDLIWCLYCDWMTGVWSLGTEMLRNVESFWCPIRFYDGKKCQNCAIDFPDVDHGWIPANGTMSQVAQTIERLHGDGDHAWFGKRVRLTVGGRTPNTPGSPENLVDS